MPKPSQLDMVLSQSSAAHEPHPPPSPHLTSVDVSWEPAIRVGFFHTTPPKAQILYYLLTSSNTEECISPSRFSPTLALSRRFSEYRSSSTLVGSVSRRRIHPGMYFLVTRRTVTLVNEMLRAVSVNTSTSSIFILMAHSPIASPGVRSASAGKRRDEVWGVGRRAFPRLSPFESWHLPLYPLR